MSKVGLFVYLVALLGSLAVISLRFSEGVPVETNVLALLPERETAEWVQTAESVQQSRGADQLIVLVGHSEFTIAKDSAEDLQRTLVENSILDADNVLASAAQYDALTEILFPYRSGLLSETDRRLLGEGKGHEISERAFAQITSPLSPINATLLRSDPLLLFPGYLSSSNGGTSTLRQKDGVLALEENGKWYVAILGRLNGDAFEKNFQSRALTVLNEAVIALTMAHKDLTILKTGAVFYGEYAYRQAEKEAAFIGSFSLLAIVLLNILVFRSLQPLLLSMLAIASGITSGLAVTLLFFGELHLLALVFGASLIGIAVDYSFHYFCERFQSNLPDPINRAKAIRSGLTLGLVSSVLGFLTLSLTPFPGLQQIALFSAAGLTVAYLTVLHVIPRIDRAKSGSSADQLRNVSMYLYGFWWQDSFKKYRVGVILVVLAIGAFGAFKITVDDDVRSLQSLPEILQAEEQKIRELSGIDNQTYQYFLRGNSSDEVLGQEEELRRDLERLKEEGNLGGYQAISKLVPSSGRQVENRKLFDEKLVPLLDDHFAALGQVSGNPYDIPEEQVTVGHITGSKAEPALSRLLLVDTPGVVIHAVSLTGVTDPDILSELADRSENIVLVNQAEGLSQTFGTYRVKSLVMLAIAYVVVWVFLSLRYGIGGAIQVVIPSLGAVLLAPCILALFGQTFTFFNAISLMLVFAIGLDYALFNRESSGDKKSRSMLANGLSALSTIFAFGLLGLSNTYAIHAFGVTIFVGILVAYALAPIASDPKQKEMETL
ncbi:MAG: MMPL family transporter [Proteobacteria bacterium]|nr:MMPL family transporter [Pseudomonadota bacterium]